MPNPHYLAPDEFTLCRCFQNVYLMQYTLRLVHELANPNNTFAALGTMTGSKGKYSQTEHMQYSISVVRLCGAQL